MDTSVERHTTERRSEVMDYLRDVETMGTDDFQTYVAQQLQAGSQRMDNLQAQLKEHKSLLAENTEATARIESNTSDIVEAFKNLTAAFKVLNWIGRFAKPISAIIGLGLTLWGLVVAVKTGVPK